MPAVTGTSVLDEARAVFLNDSAASVYTNAILLPHLKSSYEHLRNELALNSIPTLNEIQAAQTITALATVLTTIPTDMLVPVKIEERASGATTPYEPMVERTWEPNESQTERLRFWTWREEAVRFLGATTARQIQLYYLKDLNPTGIAVGDSLTASNARSYLAARVAALVAIFIQGNESLAQAANLVAEQQLEKVIKIAVKEMQARPTRRRPFLGPRRMGF